VTSTTTGSNCIGITDDPNVTLHCINTDALLDETASDAKDYDGNILVEFPVANRRLVPADPRFFENPPFLLTTR